MTHPLIPKWSRARMLPVAALFFASAAAQTVPTSGKIEYDNDTQALRLARAYLQGGDGSRGAVLEALRHMGWGVRGANGEMQVAPGTGDTGLAMRDYELEELLWQPGVQPSIRLISLAQILAVPLGGVDAEELAQDLVEAIRRSAKSAQPQERFWAHFIVALGRVSPAGYDLTQSAPSPHILPDPDALGKLTQERLLQLTSNPLELMTLTQPKPIWADDDPVLAPSPLLKRPETDTRTTTPERDRVRMDEIMAEMSRLGDDMGPGNEARVKVAQEKMGALQSELAMIVGRTRTMQDYQTAAGTAKVQRGEQIDGQLESRFMAEWRDQPLSLLQVALITRVFAADLRRAAKAEADSSRRVDGSRWKLRLPLAAIRVAQLAPGAPVSFSQQFQGAAGDIWANVSGTYTSWVLERNMPGNNFSRGISAANAIMAWFKTIMSVARQKISLKLDNEPLVRTKSHSQPGEQRTARAKVEIDFPSSDTLKALRAAMNVTSLDYQLPDGGPVNGARVVWRILEGSEATKYQAENGGWTFDTKAAVIQFAQAGSAAAYVSTTDRDGNAHITLEGKRQPKQLSPSVHPYPRRAIISVEVTIKVGNLVQDVNDAFSVALGGPVAGGLSFLADMVLRTSFFFQKGLVFPVRDWKEPAWRGEFTITVAASGSDTVKGVKGGPDTVNTWKIDRYLFGRMETPESEETPEQQLRNANQGRHVLWIDGDTRYFRVNDSSSSVSTDVENRYEAIGPMQIQPPGPNQLEKLSKAKYTGTAVLTLANGQATLELNPGFKADCIVGRYERAKGRPTVNKAGVERLDLLQGVESSFVLTQPYDGNQQTIEGSETIVREVSLPYVPPFKANIKLTYKLQKTVPPPRPVGN